MPRRNADTREEIRAVALELFATHGFSQTSLRQIAERLDITKAALYYHFPSKDELLAELAQPLVDDLDEYLDIARTTACSASSDAVHHLLSDYLELCYRHRQLLLSLVRDPVALAKLGVLTQAVHRRIELEHALVGSDAPADRARAIIAFGGLQDCVVLMSEEPLDAYGPAAVSAALRTLQPG